jgi:hypothetical protein
MQFIKNSHMVDYICMYDVYKLLYIKFVFNSFVTIIQLTDYLMWQFIYEYTIFLGQ